MAAKSSTGLAALRSSPLAGPVSGREAPRHLPFALPAAYIPRLHARRPASSTAGGSSNRNLWRLDTRTGRAQDADRLDLRRYAVPQYSLDGSRIAFQSSRPTWISTPSIAKASIPRSPAILLARSWQATWPPVQRCALMMCALRVRPALRRWSDSISPGLHAVSGCRPLVRTVGARAQPYANLSSAPGFVAATISSVRSLIWRRMWVRYARGYGWLRRVLASVSEGCPPKPVSDANVLGGGGPFLHPARFARVAIQLARSWPTTTAAHRTGRP